MAADSGQERTEEPTAKRLNDGREKGQVARSKELSTMCVLLAASGAMLLLGEGLIADIARITKKLFTIDRETLLSEHVMVDLMLTSFGEALLALTPFFMFVVVAALFAPMALSGWNFSTKAIAFKWDKMDPIKGLKRIFAVRGLVELVKALAKFGVVFMIALVLLWYEMNPLLALGTQATMPALANGVWILAWSFLILSTALILIAAIDVPFQLWDFTRQMRMTRQEIKDEFKQTDGNPEMKRAVRERQREFAEQRMMQEVPKADVVVTNPSHYAVAIRYDQDRAAAPMVVAKGKDLVALRIRDIAVANDVPILSAPPLSRALYFSTELNHEVPAGLYLAVAQVIAYIYQLKTRRYRNAEDVETMGDLPIPDEFWHDEEPKQD